MKKKLIYAVMMMSTVALLSTGFASWIISGGDSKTASGSIEVNQVNDERRNMTEIEWYKADGTTAVTENEGVPVVKYGHKDDSSVTNPWFQENGDDTVEEELVFVAKFSVDNVDSTAVADLDSIFSDVKLEAKNSADSSDYDWSTLGTAVGALPTLHNGIALVADGVNDTGTGYNFKATVTFTWGSAFNSKNPYTFLNSEYDNYDEYVAAAKDEIGLLETLKTEASKISFLLTISTIAK